MRQVLEDLHKRFFFLGLMDPFVLDQHIQHSRPVITHGVDANTIVHGDNIVFQYSCLRHSWYGGVIRARDNIVDTRPPFRIDIMDGFLRQTAIRQQGTRFGLDYRRTEEPDNREAKYFLFDSLYLPDKEIHFIGCSRRGRQ